MHLRKEVRAFAEVMEIQLRKHDKKRGKTGWKDGNAAYIASRMMEEIGEVLGELNPRDRIGIYLANQLAERCEMGSVDPKHPDKLCEELADVANLAMMLADVTCEDFCPEESGDFGPEESDGGKFEVAMTRQQWDDIINLRGVVLGSVGGKALRELGDALGATWDTSQWPDAKVQE